MDLRLVGLCFHCIFASINRAAPKSSLRCWDANWSLGTRKALEDVANVVKPDTIMGWYRKLIARKFDGSEWFWFSRGKLKLNSEHLHQEMSNF